MSVETGIILSLGLTAGILAYIAGLINTDRGAPAGNNILKILFISFSQVMLLGLPITGSELARSAGYNGIADYLVYFGLAVIVLFILFVFYLIWMYIQGTGEVISGASDRFENDEL